MVRSRYEQFRKSETETKENSSFAGVDGGTCPGGRTARIKQGLSERGNRSSTTVALKREASQRRNSRLKANEDWAQAESGSRGCGPTEGQRSSQGSTP